ncbi:hypothetical protein [Pseudogulbenkiania subflava]|uniref:Extracellular solute-binding protein, family 7 n=1 Tax=Pseudogulbenkiania subflava DSM 22618 TaxID=1123014 RepID=A0A1Y6BJ77_9NEIS|nr:hypothetical protein [Pseudogulbenkiania subflava]SMF13881.1 hypothetical protein SAMN02745746_01518 [Pseudogulbenkiania subflava DSM 22618]
MILITRRLAIYLALPLAALLGNGSAFAQDACRQAAGQQDFQIRISYGNQIDFWLRIAGALQAKGVNPANFPQAMPDGSVQIINIPFLIQMLATQRDTALGAIFQGFQQCEAGYAPYQQIVNTGVFFLTGGMSQLLPPAAAHVDVSQILGGTPFGGETALVPQARSQVLNGLGIGGDVRKVIENPRCIFGC